MYRSIVEYDSIIIGAGAAGLTAGLYAVRAGMKILVLEEASMPGGQMLLTETIENFPGFPQGIKGAQLAEKFKTQALAAGVEITKAKARQVALIERSESLNWYVVKTEDRDYSTHAIILACGADHKKLGVPREEALTGRGVSYCAICDGPLFRQRQIVVIGGGNAACEGALYLSQFASKITLVHRRSRLRADTVLQERMESDPKIDFVWNSQILEILGEEKVTGVKIFDADTNRKQELTCEGIFIIVGQRPNTAFVKGFVNTDVDGFIVTNQYLQASREGIFACGDCRAKELRQIITACGEGAEAAIACRSYVEKLKGTAYA